MKDKPTQIEDGEWYYKGCFIQSSVMPHVHKGYFVFKDTEYQETIGSPHTFAEAKSLCEKNEVKQPYFGLKRILG